MFPSWNKQNGGIAHSASNPEHVVDVSLIKILDRDFPIQITIDDAQYVYRPMPMGINPSQSYSQPYFINTVYTDRYVGRSNTSHQFNTFSYIGFDFMAYASGQIQLVIGPKDLVFSVNQIPSLPPVLPGEDDTEYDDQLVPDNQTTGPLGD